MSNDGDVVVTVQALQNDQGKVACAIYSTEYASTFPGLEATQRMFVPIKDKTATCRFSDLRNGLYAVAAFHDENDNGKLDVNWLGIPVEGSGASNGAKGYMGPPKFADAQFQYSGGKHELKVEMEYWQGFY